MGGGFGTANSLTKHNFFLKGRVHLTPGTVAHRLPVEGSHRSWMGWGVFFRGFQTIKLNISCFVLFFLFFKEKNLGFILYSSIPTARAHFCNILSRSLNKKICFIYLVWFYYFEQLIRMSDLLPISQAIHLNHFNFARY